MHLIFVESACPSLIFGILEITRPNIDNHRRSCWNSLCNIGCESAGFGAMQTDVPPL